MPELPRVHLPFVKNETNTSYSMNSLNNRSTNIHGNDYNDEVDETTGLQNRDEEARHKRTWEEKEKEESFELAEDLYSLLYLSESCSVSAIVSVGVFLLQIFILALIFADLTQDAPRYPEIVFFPLEVPVDVSTIVAVAQFISLIVATIKEEDIFISLKAVMIVGHDERVTVRFPGATPFKWWLANLLRFLTGVLNVVVSFYFIVRSSEVLDIFESFAAVEFVSYIDNMVFCLAKLGYLGKKLQRMTIKVESVRMENRREKGRWWAALVVVFLSLTLIPLTTFWIKVRLGQTSGFYLEQTVSPTVSVRFGAENLKLSRAIKFSLNGTSRDLSSFHPDDPPVLQYSYFSGTYQISHQDGKLDRYNDRPIYIERDATKGKNDPAFSRFYYCAEQSSWVYTIPGLGSALKGTDFCEWGFLAHSPKTEAYSLDEVSGNWKIWTGVISDTTITITPNSCELPRDCSLNGVCEDGICRCNENWQGQHCDVPAPYCPALVYVNYGASSYEYAIYSLEKPFELLVNKTTGNPMLLYDRPVYYRKTQVEPNICGSGKRFEVYLYTGRRWFLTYWCYEDLTKYLVNNEFRIEENLHAYWDDIIGLDIKWFSDLTSSHIGTGLQMYEVRDSYSMGSTNSYGIFIVTQGSFECLDIPCSDDPEVCGRKGKCAKKDYESKIHENTTMTLNFCECSDFYGGIYCQFNPTSKYTSLHFQEFQNNASAGLLQSPSQYEYQALYWESLVQSGESANVTIVQAGSVSDTGVVVLDDPVVTISPLNSSVLPSSTSLNSSVLPSNASTSPSGNNIFNQSEGTL